MKLSELLEAALTHDEKSFGKQFPEPALVFETQSASTGEAVAIDTPSGGSMAYRQTDALRATDVIAPGGPLSKLPSGGGKAPRGADAIVVFLQKTGRNPFAGMITLGRARNNDVCLPLPSVSKVHAYFQKKPGSRVWSLTDQRSTNGTTIDAKPLVPAAPADLHDGVRIAFGPDIRARYFTPEGLFGYLALARAGI